MNDTKISMPLPVIGMLCWEAGEQSLAELGTIPGNIGHVETFRYPIERFHIKGANYQTVVEHPNNEILARMIEAAKTMELAGIKAITTDCGFNAFFQKELASAVAIPIFTSSLLQLPMIYQMLGQGQQIGIITADKKHLTRTHLEAVGISNAIPVCIMGMENTEEFAKARDAAPGVKIDARKFIQEIVDVAKKLVKENQNVGAIVVECTDLPPASAAIRKILGLPVFDIVTLMNMVHESLTEPGWVSEFDL